MRHEILPTDSHRCSSYSQMIVSKDFSLSLNVPPYLIRGEELVLEVHIVNHLEQDIEVGGNILLPHERLTGFPRLSP